MHLWRLRHDTGQPDDRRRKSHYRRLQLRACVKNIHQRLLPPVATPTIRVDVGIVGIVGRGRAAHDQALREKEDEAIRRRASTPRHGEDVGAVAAADDYIALRRWRREDMGDLETDDGDGLALIRRTKRHRSRPTFGKTVPARPFLNSPGWSDKLPICSRLSGKIGALLSKPPKR
jgi:hypothetical protein